MISSAYIAALLMTLVTPTWPQAPSPTPTGETRGWKTYRTQKYGFEFRYPPELTAVESGPNSVERRLLAGESISGTQPPLLQTIEVKNRTNGIVLTVEIPDQKKFPVVSRDYDWSLRACGEEGFEEIKSKNETLLGRYKMLQVITTGSQFYCINFPPNPIIIFFDATISRTPVQIISTLRFLK